MSEPLQSSQTPGETVTYQPISGWAIAGLAVGCSFAVLVGICALVGLIQGAPVFLPTVVVGLAPIGIVLSWLGLRQVQISEGTRAGAKLARIGLWLSLISGLTYGSYYFFTGEALKGQANAFVMDEADIDSGFFPRIRKGGDNLVELNRAFLFTLPPSGRTGRPDNEISMRKGHDTPSKDGGPSPLAIFRESLFVRPLYQELGKDAEIIPLAVQDWRYEKRSYQVHRVYRVKTREVELDLMIVAYSVEPETSGQARKWFINLNESGLIRESRKYTPLGLGMVQLRGLAIEALYQHFAALKDEKSLGDFTKLDKTAWKELLLPEGMHDLQQVVQQAFTPGVGARAQKPQVHTQRETPGKWALHAGKIRVDLWFLCDIPPTPTRPPLLLEGVATLETNRVVDPATYDSGGPRLDWQFVSLVFSSVRVMGKQ